MSSVTRTALLSAVLVLTLGTLPTAFAAYEQCSDGLDNDGDARIDYPVDPDCVSIDDNTEALDNGVFVTLTTALALAPDQSRQIFGLLSAFVKTIGAKLLQ